MKVGLFIPCYIDAFFPEVGVATLELLERLGCSVEYPLDQTCCGQPTANSGCQDDAAATEALFVHCFQDFDTVVGLSGSCVHHVRFHLDAIEQTPQARKVRDGFVEEFVQAIQEVFPGCCLHFEDWAGVDALRMLAKYRDRVCCYNDDIQGTAGVALAGVLSALRVTGGKLRDQRVQFLGASSAGIGIFALSNPTEHAECTAEEAYRWSEGRALYAAGVPFPPVRYGNKSRSVSPGLNEKRQIRREK